MVIFLDTYAMVEIFEGNEKYLLYKSTDSTTTIGSSTTNPIARTSPKSDSVFTENPIIGNTINVASKETGTAMTGMSVALHP